MLRRIFNQTSLPKFYWLCLIALSTTAINAQTWEKGYSFGGAFYEGETGYDPENMYKIIRPNAAVYMRYHQGLKFALRGQASLIMLHGNEPRFRKDASGRTPGHKFTSLVGEFSVLPEWRVFHIKRTEFYAFSGVNAIVFAPMVTFIGENPKDGIAKDKAQVYPKAALSIPIGGGFQWFIDEDRALSFEVSGRKAYTDFIDGLSYSGNPKVQDYYFTFNVGYSVFLARNSARYGRNDRSFEHRGHRHGKVFCPKF